MKKRNMIVGLVLGMLLAAMLLAGCSGQNTSSQTSAAGGGSSAAGSGAGDSQEVQSLQGTIEQYDGDTMMIVDATGVDFLFSLEGADLHVGSEGFQVGDEVIVYYYGELVDQPDVQDVTVGEVKKADQ